MAAILDFIQYFSLRCVGMVYHVWKCFYQIPWPRKHGVRHQNHNPTMTSTCDITIFYFMAAILDNFGKWPKSPLNTRNTAGQHWFLDSTWKIGLEGVLKTLSYKNACTITIPWFATSLGGGGGLWVGGGGSNQRPGSSSWNCSGVEPTSSVGLQQDIKKKKKIARIKIYRPANTTNTCEVPGCLSTQRFIATTYWIQTK